MPPHVGSDEYTSHNETNADTQSPTAKTTTTPGPTKSSANEPDFHLIGPNLKKKTCQ